MHELVKLFEDLIKRTLAPSAAFFFFMAVAWLIDGASHDHKGKTADDERFGRSTAIVVSSAVSTQAPAKPDVLKSTIALIILTLFALLGMGYVLTMIQKILFDDRLKTNFEASFLLKAENPRLINLREKAARRVQQDLEPFHDLDPGLLTDYLLYEILGGIDPTSTRDYVDRAKSFGITAVSLMLVLILWTTHLLLDPSLSAKTLLVVVLVVILVFGYVLTRETVKAEYRARAIRHYVNFLMMPRQRLDALLLTGGEQLKISELTPKSP